MLTGIVFSYLLGQHVGWSRIVEQQMEPALAKMSPEQRAAAEQRIPVQVKFAPVAGYAFATIGPILTGLIAAGVLTLIVGGILSAGVKFKQVLAIYFYSAMPSILWTVLAIIVMFLKPPGDFVLRNPLAFNLGAFLDPLTSSKFLYSVATALDLFTFWRIILIAIGLRVAASKKLSMGGALFSVILPWAILVLIGAAAAGVFG